MASRSTLKALTSSLTRLSSTRPRFQPTRHLKPLPIRPISRPFTTYSVHYDKQTGGPETQGSPSSISQPKQYTFTEISRLSTSPSSDTILIDVREPSELLSTGRIPTAHSVPISSAPDSFFLSAEDFEQKFGFPRPSEDQEVVFYCKAGVRSRQAALLAGQAGFGGKIGNYAGSWNDWVENGGKVEAEGEQDAAAGATNVGGVPPAARP